MIQSEHLFYVLGKKYNIFLGWILIQSLCFQCHEVSPRFLLVVVFFKCFHNIYFLNFHQGFLMWFFFWWLYFYPFSSQLPSLSPLAGDPESLKRWQDQHLRGQLLLHLHFFVAPLSLLTMSAFDCRFCVGFSPGDGEVTRPRCINYCRRSSSCLRIN